MALWDQYWTLMDYRISEGATRSACDAQEAHCCLGSLAGEPLKERGHYAALCEDFPLLLRRHGLAKTLGWLHARHVKKSKETRAETAELWFLSHLCWCLREPLEEAGYGPTDRAIGEWSGLIADAARSVDLERYLILTRRCFELGDWFRSLAQVEIPEASGATPP